MNKAPTKNQKTRSCVALQEKPQSFFSFLSVQSEELEDGTAQLQQQENLVFADAGMGEYVSAPSLSYRPDVDKAAGLGSFLSRPVLIDEFSWTEGDTLVPQRSYQPWDLYFNTASIKRKLENYARIRAKLHLKFVVNASPFYYGAMRVCYCPIDAAVRSVYHSAGDQIKFSQMPGGFIYPQDMTSFELELPFLVPHAWLDITDRSEFQTMGDVDYILYSVLRSANGATGQNVTISCYAWASDVELAGLTTGLAMQADEYDSAGPISGPATAIANVASKLSSAPVIGSLARATEIGARTIGGIASLFGYSNPPVIDDVQAFAPKAFHSFASVETGVPMDKLTIDPKNEVTVDKTVTGASSDDELVISHFAGRRSFLTGCAWTDAYTPGTQLFRFPVTPRNWDTHAGVGQAYLNETPASHLGAMFSQWRGGMEYTLKFVKTRYHTGRVAISWDPCQASSGDFSSTTMTRIVDLQMETEVTFVIPYKAQDPWLKTNNIASNWAITPAGTVFVDSDSFNGYVRVTVLNELTGPANTQTIDVLLFCNGAKDLSFSVPNELPLWSFLAAQSETVDDVLAPIAAITIPADTNAVTVGETIASLRTLLHRTNFYHREYMGNPYSASGVFYTSGLATLVNYIPRFPTDFGYSVWGVNYGLSLGSVKTPFQYSPNTTLGWVTNCFAGYRGGIVHQYNVIDGGKDIVDSLTAERDPRNHLLDVRPRQAINRFTLLTTSSVPSGLARTTITTSFAVNRGTWGQRGMAITNANTQSALSVVTPQYSKWKFRPAYGTNRDLYDGKGEVESIKLTATVKGGMPSTILDDGWPVVDIYVAGGVDFDPIFFICVPTLFSYTTVVPTADDTY
jgi:hypothetical protein